MSMFNKQQEEKEVKDVETVIGLSVKVKGAFHGQGNIIVEGELSGSLKTSSVLFVGEKAKITAKVEAKDARIAGEIIGNIKVTGFLQIISTAVILGDIEYNEVSIERGAVLNGKLINLQKSTHKKEELIEQTEEIEEKKEEKKTAKKTNSNAINKNKTT